MTSVYLFATLTSVFTGFANGLMVAADLPLYVKLYGWAAHFFVAVIVAAVDHLSKRR